MSFVHLHVHSCYSLLQSTATIPSLVKKAADQGYKALALTDIDAMYGIVDFYRTCLKYKIKPILGVELLVKDPHSEKEGALVFLAKSNEGYRELLKLTSLAQSRAERNRPHLFIHDISEVDDLIVISPFDEGLLQKFIIEKRDADAKRWLTLCQNSVGKDNYFVEIQDHKTPNSHERLYTVLSWVKEESVLFIASNHVHFVEPNEEQALEVLTAIRHGEQWDRETYQNSSPEFALKSPEEMRDKFHYIHEALEQTVTIANRCNVNLPIGETVLPAYPVPNEGSARDFLRQLCQNGATEKYSVVDSDVDERLDYELSVIDSMQYNEYFLIVWDFMKYAREQGILTGPGRGSAAGSLVAYVLGITDVDPLKYDLLFERFLNPERVSMPDIDIDFSDERRDEVIEYVAHKYGKDKVAQIVTFGTLAAKAAIRDAGRALSTDSKLVDQVAKLIPSRPNVTLIKALEESDQLHSLINKNNEAAGIFSIARQIEGLPRHTSVHAAGIVISRDPLTDVVPLQLGADDLAITQYAMGDLEALGLLKMDFLGLRNLSFIEKVLHNIRVRTGQRLDIQKIPFDDSATYELLSEGKTTGIFQLESQGMKSVLQRLKPSMFEDIVAVNALYRPGPMEQIPVYIRRKHGQEEPQYVHPDLKSILERTYGVIVYQEQIMQIASKMAGFSLGEADILRRAVSKKERSILEEQRERFIRGAKQKGYAEQEANNVYDTIVRFADYGFNRSHAVAYSMISYQLAYLKANFHTEFMTSLLSSVMYNQDKIASYLYEAKQNGVGVLPPSINRSEADFTAEETEIRYGLGAVKNVGHRALEAIIAERENGPYTSIDQLCRRIDRKLVPKRALESLILAGACDELQGHRAQQLAALVTTYDQNDTEDGGLVPTDSAKEQLPEVPPFENVEALQYERDVLGTYLSDHPITPYLSTLDGYQRYTIHAAEKQNLVTFRIAGVVEEIRVIRTKKGAQMAFLTIEDEEGRAELTVFPIVYERMVHLCEKGKILFLEVKRDQYGGEEKWNVQRATNVSSLKPISEQPQNENEENQENQLFIRISSHFESKTFLHRLKEELVNHPGNTEVILYYERTKQVRALPSYLAVEPNALLISKLQSLLGEKNIYVKKEHGV